MTKIVQNNIDVYHENISLDTLYNYDDHPTQRNTEYRAKGKSKKHLRKFKSIQGMMHVIELTESSTCPTTKKVYQKGHRMMLDGHTRRHIWKNDMSVSKPSSVHITVHRVSNIKEAIDLYNCFDSMDAKETTQEKMWGIAKMLGFIGKSNEFRDRLNIVNPINVYGHIVHPSKGYNQPVLQTSKHEKSVAMILPCLKILDEIYAEIDSKKGLKKMYHTDGCLKAAHLILLNQYKDDITLTDNGKTRFENCKEFIVKTTLGSVDPMNVCGSHHVAQEWLLASNKGAAKFREYPRPSLLRKEPYGMLDIVRWVLYWGDIDCLQKESSQVPSSWKKSNADGGYCKKFEHTSTIMNLMN
jgi:hypothetical protein